MGNVTVRDTGEQAVIYRPDPNPWTDASRADHLEAELDRVNAQLARADNELARAYRQISDLTGALARALDAATLAHRRADAAKRTAADTANALAREVDRGARWEAAVNSLCDQATTAAIRQAAIDAGGNSG